MQKDTQKYSNTTVYIVIAFLAIFIIMPPLCRVLYAEEDKPVEEAPVQEEVLSDGKLICSKSYTNTGIEVTSAATYESGKLITNIIEIKNPNLLATGEGLPEAASKEFNEFTTLFSSFAAIPDTNKIVNGTTTTVTLDGTIMKALKDNEEIQNQMADALSLQNYFEIYGYTCTNE